MAGVVAAKMKAKAEAKLKEEEEAKVNEAWQYRRLTFIYIYIFDHGTYMFSFFQNPTQYQDGTQVSKEILHEARADLNLCPHNLPG